jgi:copper chaperone CopZ
MRTAVLTTVLTAAVLFASGCASQRTASPGAVGPTTTMTVDGMACENCAKHIEEELVKVRGVRAAKVDFASKTATVTLDPDNPASRKDLEGAVAVWKKEHFALEEDPECLDPDRREEIKRGGK